MFGGLVMHFVKLKKFKLSILVILIGVGFQQNVFAESQNTNLPISKIKKTIKSANLVNKKQQKATPAKPTPGIAQTDYALLGARILADIEKKLTTDEKQKMGKADIDSKSILKEQSVDNDANVWANVVIRENNAEQDIQNKKIAMMSSPSINPETGLIGLLNDDCSESLNVSNMESKRRERTTEKKIIKRNNEIANNFISKSDKNNICGEKSKKNENKKSAAAKDKKSFNVSINPLPLITSNKAYSTLSDEQFNTMEDYIDLIAPSYVPTQSEIKLSQNDNTMKLKIYRKKAENSFSAEIMHEILAKRTHKDTRTGISNLGIKDWFDEEQYGTGNNDSVAYKIMTSNLANPYVIMRNIAVIKAFQVNMSLEKYKQSLNKEALEAILIARMANLSKK